MPDQLVPVKDDIAQAAGLVPSTGNKPITRPVPLSWFQIGLIAQIVAGTLIVAIGIGSAAFWVDEIASVSVAERSFGDILRVLRNVDANMGLYYLLLHAWMWVGDAEAWVRSLSALCAVAAIPVTAILARRLFGDAVGLVAGFLMVGNTFVVANAQNARAYALALLLITVATLMFIEAIRSPRPARLILYGAASVLAVYASPLSGLVLLAHAVSIPFLPRAGGDVVRRFALTYGAVAIAVAPLAALLLGAGGEQVAWIERPGLDAALDAAWEMFGAGWNGTGNRALAVTYVALTAIGTVALWRGRPSNEYEERAWRWRGSLVIGWLFLPPILLFVTSQLEPLFSARYLLTSVPALTITAAVGLIVVARRSRVLAVGIAAVLICLAVLARIGLEPYGLGGAPQQSRDAARMIASESRPGDAIAYLDGSYRGRIGWYLEHEAAGTGALPTDFVVAAEAEALGELGPQEVSPEVLVRRLRRQQRVWLVTYQDSNPASWPGLPIVESEFGRVRSHDFDGLIEVALYERERDHGK